ncbi:MAG: hypothetical protein OXE84_03470 [Rhodobacteraceae bacterium]|nr:hypothetical protein [Paracoccaceae bacterium]
MAILNAPALKPALRQSRRSGRGFQLHSWDEFRFLVAMKIMNSIKNWLRCALNVSAHLRRPDDKRRRTMTCQTAKENP